MPTLGFHVPDDSPLIDQVKRRAKIRHAGKVSAYVRDLVQNDLLVSTGLTQRTTQPDAMAADVLVHLTEELLGKLDAKIVEENIREQDQPRLLKEILREWIGQFEFPQLVAEKPPRMTVRKKGLPPHDKDVPA